MAAFQQRPLRLVICINVTKQLLLLLSSSTFLPLLLLLFVVVGGGVGVGAVFVVGGVVGVVAVVVVVRRRRRRCEIRQPRGFRSRMSTRVLRVGPEEVDTLRLTPCGPALVTARERQGKGQQGCSVVFP